jgi:RNase P subunit RPR2
VNIPVRILVDWNRLEICNQCADRIATELTKVIRDRKPANLDISILLCDECWRYNVDNGVIKAELDPQVVRRRV